MKYYAVKKGRKTGIFETWKECEEMVKGYPQAQFKSFSTLELAKAYLQGTKQSVVQTKEPQKEIKNTHNIKETTSYKKEPIIEDKQALTKEQEQAFQLMMQGYNVFLTGEAGTGKSFVIRQFIHEMKKQHKNMIVCAPTGIAALQIHGVTIHRCFQASLQPQVNTRIKQSPKEVQKADIIIIDEISMCRIDLFDYVVRVIAKAEETSLKRKQVIVVGDFFQLPPVTTKSDREVLEQIYPDYEKGYAFESQNWKDMDFQMVVLKDIQRQNDSEFIKNLNQLRKGNPQCLSYFNQHASRQAQPNGIVLCARNQVAKDINENELRKIKGNATIYRSIIKGEVKEYDKPTEDELRLKVGARVIILINDTETFLYQNGSMGEVVELTNDSVKVKLDHNQTYVYLNRYEWEIENYTVIEEKEEGRVYHRLEKKKIGSFTQFPLKLAYAITIHKSQGQTYDKVNLIPYSFDCGQLYVALSRIKTIEGLSLLQSMKQEYLICSEKVKQLYGYKEEKNINPMLLQLGQMVYQLNQEEVNQLPTHIQHHIEKIKKHIT